MNGAGKSAGNRQVQVQGKWKQVREWVGKEGMPGCGSETGESSRASGGRVENGHDQVWRSGNVAGGRDREADWDIHTYLFIVCQHL